MEPKKHVYQPHALTLSDAIELMPFTVLVPTRLPWPEDEVERVEVRFLSPLVPGYFARLDICYRHARGATLRVREGDTSPRIDPAIGTDFSDSDQVERGGRVLRIISPTGEAGPCYVAFHHGGTHVVIFASDLERERVADFATSFEVAKPKTWRKLGASITPRGLVGIGTVLGLITGVIDGVLSPRDFSFGNLIVWVFCFGLTGFIVSLLGQEREQSRKFRMIVCAISVILLSGLGLGFRHEIRGTRELGFALIVSVTVIAVTTYMVGAIWGVIRLIRFAAKPIQLKAKLEIVPQLSWGGVWDEELDG